jgi:hypothetical protein
MIVLAREDAEVHLHALQTMTEQFQMCEWGHRRLKNLRRFSELFNISTECKETTSSNY